MKGSLRLGFEPLFYLIRQTSQTSNKCSFEWVSIFDVRNNFDQDYSTFRDKITFSSFRQFKVLNQNPFDIQSFKNRQTCSSGQTDKDSILGKTFAIDSFQSSRQNILLTILEFKFQETVLLKIPCRRANNLMTRKIDLLTILYGPEVTLKAGVP